MATPATACPILLLLSGEGGVLLSHPGAAFFGDAPQTMLDLAQWFRPYRNGIPEPFGPELLQALGADGIWAELRLPGKAPWEGRLSAHHWREVPGGPRILLLWQPEVATNQLLDVAAQRLAGRVLGLVSDALCSLKEVRVQGRFEEAHLEHLLLLFERAEGLLGFLCGEGNPPGRTSEVLARASD